MQLWKRIKQQINKNFNERSYYENQDTIRISNLRFYKLFNYIMIGLLLVLYFSTFFTDYASSLISVYWFFILLSIVELFLLQVVEKKKNSWGYGTVLFGIFKAYFFCLLTSVIFNTDGPAITYYIFLILIPVSFLLRPMVMYGMQTAALLVFCGATLYCKPMSIASGDVLSCALFYVISLVISTQIGKLRINNISMAAQEHRRREEMESQRDLLGIALRSAKLCAWNYDLTTRTSAPTYTPAEYASFDRVMEQMPDSAIVSGMVHADSVDTMRNMYHKTESRAPHIEAEVLLRGAETEPYRWFRVVMIPYRDAAGAVTHYVGTSEDITERMNLQFQYEEQLRVLYGASEDNLITKGRWNLTANCQEFYESKNGSQFNLDNIRTYDEAMHILTESIVPKEKGEEVRRILDRGHLLGEFAKGNDSFTLEYERITSTALSVWVKMLVRTCQVPGEEDIMAFGFSYDVTEEVLNRSIINRLVAIEYDFLGTLDAKTGMAVIHSAQSENMEWLNKIGIYRGAVKYENVFLPRMCEHVSAADTARIQKSATLEAVKRRLEQDALLQVPFMLDAKKGDRRKNLEFCYLDENKNIILYYGTDITELYRKEQEQLHKTEQALELAQRASSAKTDFFSRMSHDMRTPMNGILGLASLSEEEYESAVLKDYIAKIRESGVYLLGLINDTLDFQKIESGRLTLEPQLVSARDMVDTVLGMVRTVADSKGITFSMKSENVDFDRMIRVDPMRLKQIFLNLISNAVKFTKPGGRVEVCFNGKGRTGQVSHVEILICDNGIGMSEEFLKNGIFQPFSQEHNEVVANYAGSGLGLSIVKKLILLMGGSIQVESQPGEGTTFIVNLDIEYVDSQEHVEAVSHEKQRRMDIDNALSGTRILLAEDHPLNAEIAGKLLEKVGCTVTRVADGEQCLDTFAKNAPGTFDLILMDIRMPKMDGLEAARKIRGLAHKDAKNIPIIAMTANAYEEDVKNALDSGMNSHLAKPVDPMRLYDEIAKVIKK